MPDYEAHLSSYDHSHRARLRDMKALSRDPEAAEKARKAEERANKSAGIISIKLGGSTGGDGGEGKGGFKKGGFKKAGFKSAFAPVGDSAEAAKEPEAKRVKIAGRDDDSDESESDGEYERYDPRYPTSP
jgi:hypothetical protein